MTLCMTFDMNVLPGLDRSPEEGSAAGADLSPVVTVFSRSLAANLMTGDEKMKCAHVEPALGYLTDQMIALLLVGFSPLHGRRAGAHQARAGQGRQAREELRRGPRGGGGVY